MLRNDLLINAIEVGNASELTLGNGFSKSETQGGYFYTFWNI